MFTNASSEADRNPLETKSKRDTALATDRGTRYRISRIVVVNSSCLARCREEVRCTLSISIVVRVVESNTTIKRKAATGTEVTVQYRIQPAFALK